jgi:hypothetical protein
MQQAVEDCGGDQPITEDVALTDKALFAGQVCRPTAAPRRVCRAPHSAPVAAALTGSSGTDNCSAAANAVRQQNDRTGRARAHYAGSKRACRQSAHRGHHFLLGHICLDACHRPMMFPPGGTIQNFLLSTAHLRASRVRQRRPIPAQVGRTINSLPTNPKRKRVSTCDRHLTAS